MICKVSTKSHEEWKELRSHYIGGSDAAAVVGLNAYSSPYALWAEKTGRTGGFEGNLATEVGTYLEDFVAKKFAEITGKKVRNCNQSFFNDEYPWAIANIDREIVGEDAGLEIKTTSEMNLKKFKGGEYPANYYVQCVHYMAITGKSRWYLAALIGNKEFKWFTIERDQAEIDALMQAEAELWSYVESDTPPPVDGMKATGETLAVLYPNSNGDTVDLFSYSADLDRFVQIQAQIKELEQERDEAANRVKKFMGEAGAGECIGYKVTWRTQNRSSFDLKRYQKENPNTDLSEYFKESSCRIFKVTERTGD